MNYLQIKIGDSNFAGRRFKDFCYKIINKSGVAVTLLIVGTEDLYSMDVVGGEFVTPGTTTRLGTHIEKALTSNNPYIAVICDSNEVEVRVKNNYSFTSLAHSGTFNNCFSFDLVDLSCETLSSITSISDESAGLIRGDIKSLGECLSLATISLYGNPNIYGDIESLGKLTSLSVCNVRNTQVKGTWESFVRAQRTNGRINGQITFSGRDNAGLRITFNENVSLYSGDNTLSWTEDTMTLNGTTISG